MGGPTGPSALTATAAGMQAAKTVRHARAAATMREYGAEDACVRSVALFLCRWMGVRMFTVCYLPFSAVPLGNAAGDHATHAVFTVRPCRGESRGFGMLSGGFGSSALTYPIVADLCMDCNAQCLVIVAGYGSK